MRLFVDNLTNVDFSYLDDQRGLVGETWLASIELEGSLDEQGMICDFGTVKKQIRNWLDTHIDHCLVIPKHSKNLTMLAQDTHAKWSFADTDLTVQAPAQALTFIDHAVCTKASVAEWCKAQLKALFPTSIDAIHLHFSEEVIEGPYYHYSHGLKKHLGDCQRITHGHRSKIEIWKNGERDSQLIADWADKFKDIYIGTKEDIVDKSSSHFNFAYQAQQGYFALSIPQKNCHLIDTDTTVEFIALHIAETIKSQHPGETITVKAYEGNGKGAIVTR